MSRQKFFANTILWTSAITAAAIVHAPQMLTLFLLPSLATMSLIMTKPKCRKSADQALRDIVSRAE